MITSQTIRVDYVGAGSAGPFGFPFRIFVPSDLLVLKTVSAVTTILVNTTDYTVVGVPSGSDAFGNGGSVTLNVPLGSGESLSIRRTNLDVTQPFSFENAGPFFPKTHEKSFDRLTMILQQQQEILANGNFDADFRQAIVDEFHAGTDYTSGVTTTLTLSHDPGNPASVTVYFDGVMQDHTKWSLAGLVITFRSVISATLVEVQYRRSVDVVVSGGGGGGGSVTYPTLTSETGVVDEHFYYTDPRRFGGAGDGVTDNETPLTNIGLSLAAQGGGTIEFPGYGGQDWGIGSDVSIDRSVNWVGKGGTPTRIFGLGGSQFRFIVTGAPAGATDAMLGQNVWFDTVSLEFGTRELDQGRGFLGIGLAFTNSDRGLYLGSKCFNMSFLGCRFRQNVKNVLFDLANALPAGGGGRGTGSGASMFFSSCMLGECVDSLYVNGNTNDGFDLTVQDCDFTLCSNSCVKVVASTGESVIKIINPHFELMGSSAVFVDNEGAHVFIHHVWALSATEFAWVRQRGAGEVFLLGGGRGSARNSGSVNYVATFTGTGGLVILDQSTMFSNFKAWGIGSATPCVDPASTGTGRLVAPRGGYAGSQLPSPSILLTNGSPTDATTRVGEVRDGNRRTIEATVQTAGDGLDNTIRVQLADGVNTNFVDFTMPLVSGTAWLRISINPDQPEFRVHGMYAPVNTAGSAISKTAATVNPQSLTNTKFLQFESLNTGGTASAMSIEIVRETISGPPVTGLA